jgi:uncharacterized protein with HEPN domain
MGCVPSSRPAIRLRDILDNVRRVRSYVEGMDRATFETDERTRDAVERCLERISEAATKLGSEAEQLAPGPPWASVRAFGNVLRHAYDQVDPLRIWQIVADDLPALEMAVVKALRQSEGGVAGGA